MPDLFQQTDPLIAQLPAAFVEQFNEREAAKRIQPWALRKHGRARLAVAEYLRRVWNRAFDGQLMTYFLTTARLELVSQLLGDADTPGFSVGQLARAIRVYAEECRTMQWRQKNATARKSFDSFLRDSRLDLYVSLGDQVRKQAIAAQLKADESQEKARVLSEISRHGANFHALLAKAARDVGTSQSLPFNDPRVQARMLELLHAEPAKAGPPLLP